MGIRKRRPLRTPDRIAGRCPGLAHGLATYAGPPLESLSLARSRTLEELDWSFLYEHSKHISLCKHLITKVMSFFEIKTCSYFTHRCWKPFVHMILSSVLAGSLREPSPLAHFI